MKHRALIVDDERSILDLMSDLLTQHEFDCQCEDDPRMALMSLLAINYDLMICGLTMPHMTGVELVEMARIHQPQLTIVCYSGQDKIENAVNAMQVGADGYVTKPSSSSEFMSHIYHAMNLRSAKNKNQADLHLSNNIVREIQFTEDTLQAGMSLLNYFSTIVYQKYPNVKVKVTIQQLAKNIKLIIETPDGDRDEIEHTLEEYGMVITGKLPLGEFLSNPFHVIQLENKLKVAEVELNMTKSLLAIQEKNYESRINFLENQFERLHDQITHGFNREERAQEILSQSINKIGICPESKNLLLQLIEITHRTPTLNDKETIKELISEIKRNDPSVIKFLAEFVTNTAYGVSGNATFLILQEALKSFRI